MRRWKTLLIVGLGVALWGQPGTAEDVFWSLDASGNWNVESNWSTGALPTSADNVTIDRPGDITVTVDERAVTIVGLNSADNLNISGQRFTVSGAGTVSGDLDLLDATMTASGAASSFTTSGGVTVADSSLSAVGGQIQLPGLTETNVTSGSRNWTASSNGLLDLSNVATTTVSGVGRLTIDAQTGGTVDLSGLTTLASNDGTRNTLRNSSSESTLLIDALESADNIVLAASAGGQINLPAMTSYATDASSITWSSSGAGSALNLPNLETISTSGTGALSIQSLSSAQVNLQSLTSFANDNNLRSNIMVTGADSTLDVSQLAAADDVEFTASAGGNYAVPALAGYTTDGRSLTWSADGAGSGMQFPSLETITIAGVGRIAIQATNGGAIDLSVLTAIDNTVGSRNTLTATGNGSQIQLDALATADDVNFTVSQGGVLRMPAVADFSSTVSATWDASGAGSELALPNLTSITSAVTGRLTVQAGNGATIDLNKLASIDNPENARITIGSAGRQGKIQLGALTAAQAVTLTADAGSQLDLPMLSDFTLEGSPVWTASGLGSQLNFGTLAQLTASETSRLTVNATGGGAVDLSALTTISNPQHVNRLTFNATGTHSRIDLSTLTSAPSMQFAANDGGTIDLSNLTEASESAFTISGERTQMTLPLVTSFDTTVRSLSWNVSGYQSELAFPALTTISASASGRLTVNIAGGSHLDWSALETINNPDFNTFSVTSSDLATTANLSQLTSARNVSLATANGGAMDLSGLSDAGNSSFGARGGSTLVLPAIENFTADTRAPIWEASGFGGRLAFPALTQVTITDNASFSMNAQSGGELDLSNLTTIEHANTRAVAVTSSGINSIVKLGALTSAAIVGYEANQRGSIDLSMLASAPDSNFTVRSGSQMTLPALAEFEVAARATTWSVVDVDSELSFPQLTTITLADRGSLSISVGNGGQLDLSSLTAFDNPTSKQVSMTAAGPGSRIDAPALTSFQGSTMDAGGGATIQLSSETTTFLGAQLVVRDTGTINAGTVDLQAGSQITGNGTVHANVNNVSRVLPGGNAAATLGIDGSYTQAAEGVLEIGILGPTLDFEYDQLVVSEAASIAGSLAITVSGYVPELGTMFQVLDAPAGLTGTFSTMTTTGLPNSIGLAPIYEVGGMLVRASLKGDVDLDGSVVFSDFLQLSSNFGAEGDWSSGDFDGDGLVGFPDFLSLSSNFGQTEPTPAANVPEPSAAMWLGLAGMLLSRARPRRFCRGT